MSQIAVLECGYVAPIQARQEEIFLNPIMNRDFIPNAEAFKYILQSQAGKVNFKSIEGLKDTQLIMESWGNCEGEVTECTSDCAASGDDITPTCTTIELNLCKEKTFGLYEKTYRTKTIEASESIAINMLKAKKKIAESISTSVIAAIIANAGVNKYNDLPGVISGNNTYIPAVYWTDAKIIGYLEMVAKFNNFNMPWLLDGNNLWNLSWLSTFSQVPDNAKIVEAALKRIPLMSDVVNIKSLSPGSTFMLNSGAIGVANKAYWPYGAANAQRKAGNQLVWSEDLMVIPGQIVDVVMTQTCVDNDYYDSWKLKWTGGIYVNPTGCDEDVTGILEFNCGDPV